jgi:hypothetical protein
MYWPAQVQKASQETPGLEFKREYLQSIKRASDADHVGGAEGVGQAAQPQAPPSPSPPGPLPPCQHPVPRWRRRFQSPLFSPSTPRGLIHVCMRMDRPTSWRLRPKPPLALLGHPSAPPHPSAVPSHLSIPSSTHNPHQHLVSIWVSPTPLDPHSDFNVKCLEGNPQVQRFMG